MQEDSIRTFEYGPYINAALICENIIEDKHGVLSAIRIIDRIVRTAQGPNAPKEMEPFEYEFYILVVLKTGEAGGTYTVTIQPKKPIEDVMPPFRQTVHLEPTAERGANIVAKTRFRFDVPGLWWFDVLLNEVRITRMYLRIIYLPTQTGIQS
ncbi:hypothetical protein [Candidatus Nitrospira bockiana]